MMQVCSENRRWEVGMRPLCGSSLLQPMPTARLTTQGDIRGGLVSVGESSLSEHRLSIRPLKACGRGSEEGVA